jgi:hypothetical protein
VEGIDAQVTLSDFVTTAVFDVPNFSPWDVGFFFRQVALNNGLRLVVSSDGDYALMDRQGDETDYLADGSVSNLNLAVGSRNELTLVAAGGRGYLFVNDALAAELDLSARSEPGTLFAVTEALLGHEADGASTAYRGFSVWRPIAPAGSGQLRHVDDSVVTTVRAGVVLRDFVVTATCTNPYVGDWDIGFIFRAVNAASGYRLILDSSSTWYLYYRDDENSTLLDSGPISNFNTAEGGQNQVLLLAHGGLGRVFVNGSLLVDLSLGAHLDGGDLSLASGLFSDNERDGAVTAYADFAVWPIP